MKRFLLSILLIYLVHCSDGAVTEKYTTRYDGINLDEILESDRLLTGYVNCLLDLGPCTPDGKELKRNLPDAIDNDCAKCTERQREGADQVMFYIIDHRPDDWDKLEIKYKSDGSYKKKYLESKKKSENKDEEKSDDEPEKANQNDDDDDDSADSNDK
ncbi:ejaculatory bulb-specific protein 3-like [Pectinophora gossypiella]|uniref:ejaculatory bulb-specific protein 3-like n=1 Tax=Pectinophora gossypiella TaxID=13191 RepID=UPI00214EF064|nr:ejaculatory bulb-specific protein 3-like [Pectinophora gossypiella]XP_049877086.1 ejaculatory bulb-specific protein 3-like [Pectinophora gossypiella]